MFLSITSKKLLVISCVLFISLFCSTSFAKQYSFIVQPIYAPEKMVTLYKPLVQYLKEETGHSFSVVTSRSFISYWEKMKKGQYDLILDAAHFTDYRINRLNYSVLVKVPSTESYSLVTNSSTKISDTKNLIGKKLVTLPSPSLSGVHLARMFPNPAQQPDIKGANSAESALKALQKGQYFAALIPTSLLAKAENINTVNTSIAMPRMAISASPKINKDVQEKIRAALIRASTTAKGKKMLSALQIPAFAATDAKTYQGYGKLLAGVWGY